MKIGVVMFYDDNIKIYGDINHTINKKYCEKYNLTLIVSNKKNILIDIQHGKDYHYY